MKAEAEWTGTIRIRDTEITGSFLVFNSSGGWAFLLGKPLLIAFKAIHEYKTDTITIGNSNSRTTLDNRFHDRTHLCIAGNQNHTLDIKQIATASTTTQWIQHPQTTQAEQLQRTTRNTSLITNDPNTVQTYTTELSKESENTFTQQTELFKSQRVEYILKSIKMGDDITWEERMKVEALVAEYANVFACSLSEVLLIPGTRVNLNVPADAKLSTSIKQCPLSLPQKQYMHAWTKQMLDANMTEKADFMQIKHVTPTVLTQKTHDATKSMTLEDLQAEVNRQCQTAGITAPFNITHPLTSMETEKNMITGPPKWRVMQNFAELNKVTQVPPLYQGDIQAKQQWLSGHN